MKPLLLLLPALGLVASGCGHSSSHTEVACCPPPSDARVAGVLVGVGGPPGAGTQHWRGTIHVHGRVSTEVETDRRGRFTLTLPPGRYLLTGTSPSYDDGRGVCRAGEIRVAAHRTGQVRVVCQLK